VAAEPESFRLPERDEKGLMAETLAVISVPYLADQTAFYCHRRPDMCATRNREENDDQQSRGCF
jgi:hypothetical protein